MTGRVSKSARPEGTLKAMENVRKIIAPKVCGMDVLAQRDIHSSGRCPGLILPVAGGILRPHVMFGARLLPLPRAAAFFARL
jgi:hypothetical protein